MHSFIISVLSYLRAGPYRFSRKDAVGNQRLALDAVRKKLLFWKSGGRSARCLVVNLKQLAACTVIREYEPIGAGGLKRKSLEHYVKKVAICMRFRNQAPAIILPLYDNREHEPSLVLEAEAAAARWNGYILDFLQN